MQDSVAIVGTRIAWTEGRVQGFIPWSIFLKDESANKDEESILFYQVFGFDGPAWRSLDEHPFPEATVADFYDAINRSGRWEYLRYMGEPPKTQEEADARRISASTAKQMLIDAGFEVYEPQYEERFHLVQAWESFISYEKYQEEMEAQWALRHRAMVEKRAKERCPACATGDKLYGDGYRYFHRKDFAFVKCLSSEDHQFLETEAWEAYSATSKSNYHLLRGHIDHYSRTHSSRRHIRSHSAFQKILQMGPEAIPFILNDLRKGRVGGIWTAEVLAELTGRRGGDPSWWIAWAKAQNYELLEV